MEKLHSIGLKRLLDNIEILEALEFSASLRSSDNTTSKVTQSLADYSENAPLCGKWYFYFPSSDSSIVEQRKKRIIKDENVEYDSLEENELLRLYSDDHIYSGIIIFAFDLNSNQYAIQLKYLSNPDSNNILQYDGVATLSMNGNALFATLTNQKDRDTIYLIIDNLYLKTDVKYIMASVLTLSKNKDEFHRRPCSLRMIMSRSILEPKSPAYDIMISNLMMNDSVIRIDDNGYGELLKLQSHYSCSALDRFLEMYPDINTMEETSNYITVHKCAYISESLLKNLKDEDQAELLYLEAILRLHSTAPWYSKAKAVKINDALKKYENFLS